MVLVFSCTSPLSRFRVIAPYKLSFIIIIIIRPNIIEPL